MNLFLNIIFFSLICSLISMVFNKKFLLSILIALELILLNLLITNIIGSLLLNSPLTLTFSLFILTLSAIEAAIGISLLTITTRNLNNSNVNLLNTLKI